MTAPMTDIIIPPEVRFAAQAVIGDHVPLDTIDRAIRATLAAWPGASAIRHRDGTVLDLILPLPQEPRDDA